VSNCKYYLRWPVGGYGSVDRMVVGGVVAWDWGMKLGERDRMADSGLEEEGFGGGGLLGIGQLRFGVGGGGI
jgi:hypothetical protein